MSTDAFHVLKFIPYRRRNAKASSSSSSSDNDSNISQVSLDSSVESSTDSEFEHVSTPSDKSSASSREEEVDRDNQLRIEKKVKFPKKPLYLDDTQLGQGRNMHVVQL